jgi:hypothetical protein
MELLKEYFMEHGVFAAAILGVEVEMTRSL